MRLFWHKLTHWEYWPFALVYFPIFFLWAYYAIRARSLFFFNASNPTIQNGGFMMESKKAIYDLIPHELYPTTLLIAAETPIDNIIKQITDAKIQFPLIAKPDIGLRGAAVKKIESVAELQHYNNKAYFDYIVQDVIRFPNEVGIFYVRFPNQPHGKITGIVAKEFMVITGDGKRTMEQLVVANPRYAFQLKSLRGEYGAHLADVLPAGVQMKLSPYGNHARGAKFLDVSDWNSRELEQRIDGICQRIDGFYFGRIDIMYNTIGELERGVNFSIVEVNGAASEPTHIYDPKHSIFFAWKELARHISMMYQISVINHRNGAPYLSHSDGMSEYSRHLKHEQQIFNF